MTRSPRRSRVWERQRAAHNRQRVAVTRRTIAAALLQLDCLRVDDPVRFARLAVWAGRRARGEG
jgi:hypothetical protein